MVYDAQNLSLAEYLDRWSDTIRGTLAPKTVRRHDELTRIHIKPALGKVKLSKLNPLQVQSFYRVKLNEGFSAATVVKIHSTLSKSLKQVVRWRLVPLNVCESVTPSRVARTEIAPLDDQQMNALLETAEGTELYALFVCALTPPRVIQLMSHLYICFICDVAVLLIERLGGCPFAGVEEDRLDRYLAKTLFEVP